MDWGYTVVAVVALVIILVAAFPGLLKMLLSPVLTFIEYIKKGGWS